jgi:metacaspase-1
VTEHQKAQRAHLALHVGVNAVDPRAYGGFTGSLLGCENDAASMLAIAVENGFTAETFVGSTATAGEVLHWLRDAGEASGEGDMLLLTFSGYGGAAPADGGAADLADTWAMFDRQLLLDELLALFARFRAGVRLVVVADCSHRSADGSREREGTGHRSRSLPRDVAFDQYTRNEPYYESIRLLAGAPYRPAYAASMLWLGACQANQLALEGASHGLFTETLLAVYNDSTFDGDYAELLHRIVQRMPSTQSPAARLFGTLETPIPHPRAFRPA